MATTDFLTLVLKGTADHLNTVNPAFPLTADALTEVVFTQAYALIDQGHDVYGHDLTRRALAALPKLPATVSRAGYADLVRQQAAPHAA
ncbi:hypothetical protein AB0A05_07435 [Streptomyces sp. NPDC046374]|uniref:hypothetical protein n=1 Tax=Streptomyces sp. NPDC046374 TaxID=3154917 RepID=UPI0033E19CE6